jgi:hypothetical protein
MVEPNMNRTCSKPSRSKLIILALAMIPAALTAASPAGGTDAKLIARFTEMRDTLKRELLTQIPDLKDAAAVKAVITNDRLDAKLVPFVVLQQGTPSALAAFAQEGAEQAQLLDRLLSDAELLKQMLVADGPRVVKDGPEHYGPAMKVYTDILKASPKAKEGILQRLAVACALEQETLARFGRNPVTRYLAFEKAYLHGELDPDFPKLDTWNLRFVVNGNEHDWELAWGRKVLRNLRPDHIYTKNTRNRYAGVVSSNVHYGSVMQQFDRPELSGYQNILMNGGICGRRAFFGQFICRSFGIPSVKRPSKRHGAMARWTPDGWVVCLGPGWGSGNTNTIYSRDRAFLESSQARRDPAAYLQVKRAMWIGDLMGESRFYGGQGKPNTWGDVSLRTQQEIIKQLKIADLAPEGAKFGEADDLTITEQLMASDVSDKERQISVDAGGTITIPAAAHATPHEKLSRFDLLRSFEGGLQAYFSPFNRKGVSPLRGGSETSGPENCTSSRRISSGRMGRYPNWGMRVAVTLDKGEVPTPGLTLDLGLGVSLEFVYIKPGRFVMGGERDFGKGHDCPETPKHEVEITRGFYLGKYELTIVQYEALKNPEKVSSLPQPNHPKGMIGVPEAAWFCRIASAKTGRHVRLPTEAEWEYAARAGTSTTHFFGDDPSKLGDYAWFNQNSGRKLQEVGQKKPNPWGLYDIYGNVWELTSDIYDPDYYANSPKQDPKGAQQDSQSHVRYEVQIPKAGKYALSARVVTMNYHQMLQVAVNDQSGLIRMDLPFTCGDWQDSEPVALDLKQGTNFLEFSRAEAPQNGIAAKSFTLKPL